MITRTLAIAALLTSAAAGSAFAADRERESVRSQARSCRRSDGPSREADDPRQNRMKHLLMPVTLCVSFFLAPAAALANNVHISTGMKGQPSQTCGTAMTGSNTPGHAASAPGSPFNPNGNAGTHYAGTQPQNSKNPKSVAQYDVACFQNSHAGHH